MCWWLKTMHSMTPMKKKNYIGGSQGEHQCEKRHEYCFSCLSLILCVWTVAALSFIFLSKTFRTFPHCHTRADISDISGLMYCAQDLISVTQTLHSFLWCVGRFRILLHFTSVDMTSAPVLAGDLSRRTKPCIVLYLIIHIRLISDFSISLIVLRVAVLPFQWLDVLIIHMFVLPSEFFSSDECMGGLIWSVLDFFCNLRIVCTQSSNFSNQLILLSDLELSFIEPLLGLLGSFKSGVGC